MKLLTSFLIILLTACSLLAQETGTLQRTEYTRLLGLHTAMGDFQRPEPHSFYPEILHNIDLSRGGDYTYSKRYGYSRVFTFPGVDSVMGIFPINYRDGRDQLVAVADSADCPTGVILGTAENSDQFGTVLDSFQVVIYKDEWANFQDVFGTYKDTAIYEVVIMVGADTATIRDTVEYPNFAGSVNDSLVARINADPDVSDDVTAAVVDDTTLSIVADLAGTGVEITVAARRPNQLPWWEGGDNLCYIGPFDYGTCPTFIDYFYYPGVSGGVALSSEWGILHKTSATQYNDQLFIANEGHTGYIYTGGTTIREWPTPAPGTMKVIPLDSAGSIDGEVRYCVRYTIDSISYDYAGLGALTQPVKGSGSVRLKEFPMPAIDSTETDSIFIQIYRTRENPGRMEESDYVFKIYDDTLVETTWADFKDTLANLVVVDGSDDANYSTYDSLPVYPGGYNIGYDQATDTSYCYFGGVRIDGLGAVVADSGVYMGSSSLVYGVSYIVTYLDTVTGVESSPSKAAAAFRAFATEDAYDLQIPLPANTGYKINLYRATIVSPSYDSVQYYYEEQIYPDVDIDHNVPITKAGYRYSFTPSGDTLTGPYRFLDQLDPTVSTYYDTISIASIDYIEKTPPDQTPPAGMSNIFTYDNRIWGIVGSQLWYTEQGGLDWEQFNLAQFNPDDGDQGTIAFPFRGGVFFAKNYSAYNLYEDRTLTEITGAPGCVAPSSHISAEGVNYYMGNSGVISLTDGQFLIRRHQPNLLSKEIDNFKKKTFDELTTTVGQYVPQRDQIWFCVGDTTYCWDLSAQEWSTSSLTFAGGCLYDPGNDFTFKPGRTFYFYKSGGSSIYKFGDVEYDDGNDITITILSMPIYQGSSEYQMYGLGLWSKYYTADGPTQLGAAFYGTNDSLLTIPNTDNRVVPVELEQRKAFKEFLTPPSLFFKLYMTAEGAYFIINQTTIDRIDLFYKSDVEDIILE